MGTLLRQLQDEGVYLGKYRAQVVDNADPKNLMRARLIVPEVLGEDVKTGWANPNVPVLGGAPNVGFYAPPPNGSRVWCEFESGDPNRPIWTGYWYAEPGKKSEAPKDLQGASYRKYGLRTPAGNTISFDDQSSEIEIKHPTFGSVKISPAGIEAASGLNVNLTGAFINLTGGVVTT